MSRESDGTCEYESHHLALESRLTELEAKMEALADRFQDADLKTLRDLVSKLVTTVEVLKVRLWFYQVGSTAAGGLIVILLERLLRRG